MKERLIKMKELYNMGISEQTIKAMVELNPEVADIADEEIKCIEDMLAKVGCSNRQILNIISSNSMFLTRTKDELIKLLDYLTRQGFKTLNILFDSNPYILNLEPFEIKEYIENRVKNGEALDDVVDDMDSNPYLFCDI